MNIIIKKTNYNKQTQTTESSNTLTSYAKNNKKQEIQTKHIEKGYQALDSTTTVEKHL